MNLILTLNDQHFAIRSGTNKVALYELPSFNSLHKLYMSCNFSALNQHTLQLLVLSKNILNILKPTLLPLELTLQQQSFLDWQPSGGIILKDYFVLYDVHSIVFYQRVMPLEKSWEIEVVQDIEQIKSSKDQLTLAMKASQPANTLFLWNMEDISLKPIQEITLATSIAQWQFVAGGVLTILTPAEFRVYYRGTTRLFHLQHFYAFTQYCSFCWLGEFNHAQPGCKSVNTVAMLGQGGTLTIYQLFDLDRITLQSIYKPVGKLDLAYKNITMRKIIGGWQGQSQKLDEVNKKDDKTQSKNVLLACENKNGHLFTFTLNEKYEIVEGKAQQQLIGIGVSAVQSRHGVVLMRQGNKYRLLSILPTNQFKPIRDLHCEQAVLGANGEIYCFKEQTVTVELVHHNSHDPAVPMKYSENGGIFYLGQQQGNSYFVQGIRYFKLSSGKAVTSAGLAMRNQKAKLIEASVFSHSLLYQMGDQFLLLDYSFGDKVITKSVKSSTWKCRSLMNGKWAELRPLEVHIGDRFRTLTVFSLPNMYKLLGVDTRYDQYDFQPIPNNGFVLILRNYAFFLQLVEDSNGFEVIVLKKTNSLLHKRFLPNCELKLINPHQMIFWAGNTLLRLGHKLNRHVSEDPYTLADTLIRRQLQTKLYLPAHHPRAVNTLIECGNVGIAIEMLKRLMRWFENTNRSLEELYQEVGLGFLREQIVIQNEGVLIDPKKQQEDIEFLRKLSTKLLSDKTCTDLKQDAAQLLQQQIQVMLFSLLNSRSLDSYSQVVLLLSKTVLKNKPISSMHIAHLLHSINQEQFIAFVKPERVDWQWMTRFSIVLWYRNVQQIKQWVQEIAANQFRVKKDPFDCLFWYILCGKKNLLIMLFKSQKFDSKEHDAMHAFLQRDFSQAKDKSAAVKNAYVLVDKKRYLHALAFFILGDKVEECIRFCLDRLKDVSLAFLFCLMFKNINRDTLMTCMQTDGDIWIKHIACVLDNRHIDSYNVLFEIAAEKWEYQPSLTGFHPAAIYFANRLLKTVPLRRQLEASSATLASHKNNELVESKQFDNDSSKDHLQTIIQSHAALAPEIKQQKQQAIRFYICMSLPSHALLVTEDCQEAHKCYELEKYQLMGQISPSIQKIAFSLEDAVGIVKHFLSKQDYGQLLLYVLGYRAKLQHACDGITFLEFVAVKKYAIGQLLHYCYFADEICLLLTTDRSAELEQQTIHLRQASLLAKLELGLALGTIEDLHCLISAITGKDRSCSLPSDYWQSMKSRYEKLAEKKKEKNLKLMDQFQHVFVRAQRNDSETIRQSALKLQSKQACLLKFKSMIFSYLGGKATMFARKMVKIQHYIEEACKKWITEELNRQIDNEFRILGKEGSQIRIKLNHLSEAFVDDFADFCKVFSLVNVISYSSGYVSAVEADKSGNIQAIEIFRNKIDPVYRFALNRNQGRGLEAVLLFKKSRKKIEICDCLLNRERTKDGYSLIADQPSYFPSNQFDFDLLLANKQPEIVENAVKNILNSRTTLHDSFLLRKNIPYSAKHYLKQADSQPPLEISQGNSIECHDTLPFFLLGMKGIVEVCSFSNNKSFNRVKCPGIADINKIVSYGHRLTVLDGTGCLASYHFDVKFVNNCVFSLKKSSIIDYCHLNTSVLGAIDRNGLQVYDTLLHPKRQSVFKLNLTNQPICMDKIDQKRVAVVRKSQLLIYDIRMQRLQESKDLKGKGRSIHISQDIIYIGQTDEKVRSFQIGSESSKIFSIRSIIGMFISTQTTNKGKRIAWKRYGRCLTVLFAEVVKEPYIIYRPNEHQGYFQAKLFRNQTMIIYKCVFELITNNYMKPSKKRSSNILSNQKSNNQNYLDLSHDTYLIRTLKLLGVSDEQYQKQTKSSLNTPFTALTTNAANSKQFYFIASYCLKHLLSAEEFKNIQMWYPPKSVNEQLEFKKAIFKQIQRLESNRQVPKNLMLSRMAILGDTSTSTVVEFLRILSELALRASYIELYSKNNRLIQVSFGREDTNEYQDINRFYPYPFVEAKSDKDISILPQVVEQTANIYRLHIDRQRKKILALSTVLKDSPESIISCQQIAGKLMEQKQLAATLSSKVPKSVFSQNRSFDRRVIIDKHRALWKDIMSIECHYVDQQQASVLKCRGEVDKILHGLSLVQGVPKLEEINSKLAEAETLKQSCAKIVEQFRQMKRVILERISNTKAV